MATGFAHFHAANTRLVFPNMVGVGAIGGATPGLNADHGHLARSAPQAKIIKTGDTQLHKSAGAIGAQSEGFCVHVAIEPRTVIKEMLVQRNIRFVDKAGSIVAGQ